jgi:hypothetical protein
MTGPIPPPAAVRGMTVWQPQLFTLTARLPCVHIQAGGRRQSQLSELSSSLIPPVLYRLSSWLGWCQTRCWMTSPIPSPAAVWGMTVWQPQLFTLTARLPFIQIQAGGALSITAL